MGTVIRLPWGVSRVVAPTLDLLEDEERRCLDLSILQISVLRQMAYPWGLLPSRLVEDHGDWQEIVEQPQAYIDALEELEILLSGAYDGPETGCPVGEIFVDRGDPAAGDFSIAGATLIADSTWREIDVSGIVDEDATRVLLEISCVDNLPNLRMSIRAHGRSNTINMSSIRSQVADVTLYDQVEVVLLDGLTAEYYIQSGMNGASIVVGGWWVPA